METDADIDFMAYRLQLAAAGDFETSERYRLIVKDVLEKYGIVFRYEQDFWELVGELRSAGNEEDSDVRSVRVRREMRPTYSARVSRLEFVVAEYNAVIDRGRKVREKCRGNPVWPPKLTLQELQDVDELYSYKDVDLAGLVANLERLLEKEKAALGGCVVEVPSHRPMSAKSGSALSMHYVLAKEAKLTSYKIAGIVAELYIAAGHESRPFDSARRAMYLMFRSMVREVPPK